MYKLVTEHLNEKVRSLDKELIDICKEGGNAFPIIDLKRDILELLDFLRHQ